MFSFLKRKKVEQVPEWANFFNATEYSHFISEIDQYFQSHSLSFEMFDGWIKVGESDLGLNDLGLVNIAQVCKQADVNSYKELINDHFDTLIRTNQFNVEFEKIEHDFDKIKSYIGVRLYNESYFKQVGIENTIGEYLSDNIYSTLVFDLPDSISSIKPEQAEKWGKENGELMKLGIENIKQKHQWQVSEEQFDNFKIWFIQSDHFFAPNIVFDLENKKELLSDKGILIGMPHRHAVLIYPIKTIETVEAINGLIPIIYGMNLEGPGSLTNNLYYYKSGTFVDLPYQIEDNKIQFYPPQEFADILNNLK